MNPNLKQLMSDSGYAAPELATRAKLLADLLIFECIKIAVFSGDNTTAQRIRERFQNVQVQGRDDK